MVVDLQFNIFCFYSISNNFLLPLYYKLNTSSLDISSHTRIHDENDAAIKTSLTKPVNLV